MSFKLNKKAIENYSNTFPSLILNQAFYTRDFLGGQEISKLTETPQINVLVLKILFEKWNEQAEKLRSKYFDFTHPDVAQALQTFKNKLSHHIKIDKDTFTPLLEEAIRNTLSLIFEPKEAVKTLFLNDVSHYKDQLKFLKIHPQLVKALLEINDASKEELYAVVNTWENFTKPTELLEQTSKIHRGIVEDFVINEVEPSVILSKKVEITNNVEEPKTVNDVFANNQEPVQNLAAQFQNKQKITSLQTGININQRFSFIKELFDGDTEVYNKVIEQLDILSTLEDADDFLNQEIALKYHWEEKTEVVDLFYEVLNKKY